MVVKNVENITRKPMLIAYRKEYLGDAVMVSSQSQETLIKIEFSIEMTPLGDKVVRIQFLQDIHYPLVPILRNLKDHIGRLERSGSLP
ncbi:MAG: hypothetical protein GW949_07565 [Spirochaetales bacterium]|nr:hypothetical protein [Spirochaetales bacterium]